MSASVHDDSFWGMAMATGSTPLLTMGSFSEAVRTLQKALNLAPTLLPRLAEDASFGPRTRGRVLEFQGKQNLAQDGQVGPMTWAALQPWLDLVKGIATAGVSPPGEAAARARIRQIAEDSLALYGWNSVLPKDPKTKAVDRAALRVNPMRIAAAYCADASSPLRPRAGGSSLALIFQGAGGTKSSQVPLCMSISSAVEASYQMPSGPDKTQKLNQNDIGSWCGVFATFVCRMAGLKLQGWPLRMRKRTDTGPTLGFEFQQIQVTDDVQIGDIGIFDSLGSNHHFVVVDVAGDTVSSIDGNVGDPDFSVVAPWSSVLARRSYKRNGPATLRTLSGRSSSNCYFMRPIWENVLGT